jgi:hypothetical protein
MLSWLFCDVEQTIEPRMNENRKKWLAAMVAALMSAGAWAAGDPEVDYWFNRHAAEEWRPLMERWDAAKAAMTSPVEQLVLPLDAYPNGRIKARLRAEKAQMLLEDMIFAEGVTVELFSEEGRADGKLTAEGCLFDRKNKNGYCEGLVGVEKDGDRLKGKGMYFSFEAQFIKIMADCEIRTQRMKNNFGRIW